MDAKLELARRLFNKPIALAPSEADVVAALLRNPQAVAYVQQDYRREYGLIDGVAIIPVRGVLFQQSCYWWDSTGYDFIRRGFLAAVQDPEVKAIVLDIDSPGGEVAGCFDLVDTIYNARGAKPIHAILDESAYSAAYAIASAADSITVPRTGGVGSIGVIWMHMDFSQALANYGVNVTFITYGDRKADGHPEIPLDKEAKARFQTDINSMGELFVETVARNRNIAASKVRDTEAMTFLGANGVDQKLADAVMAPDAAFRALLDKLA